MDSDAEATPQGRRTARPVQFVFERYSNEHAVYGVVLVSALIAVGWEFETDLDVLWFIFGTVGVFWVSHIYAAVVSSRRTEEGRTIPIGRAIAAGARQTSGILVPLLIPAAFLGGAALGWLDEYVAYYLALGVGVVVLGIIGYVNSARNKSPWHLRVVSIVLTAGLGLAVIWLGTLVH